MPNTVAQHAVATFTSPVNGTTPIDANTVRGNDNTTRTSYNNHDADPGIHLQSSTLASRPVAGTAGRKWITADTGSYRVWYDDGTTWQEVTYLSGGGGTISGSLLITGTLGVTGLITATGGVSGNVTGNLTGNASTATALQTARNINGVSFNGTADITVTAAAGTLTGSTLAAGVTASSLTSVGTLANLTVTNPITGSVTGSAGSVAASALTGSTLASGVTASSLTSVGTLTALAISGNVTVDTDTLFVDAANNRVGIGTASPSYALDVKGIFSLEATNSTNDWLIYTNTDNTLRFNYTGAGNDEIIAYSNGDLAVDTNTLFVDAVNNRVGVGTVSPITALHVNDAVGASFSGVFRGNGGTNIVGIGTITGGAAIAGYTAGFAAAADLTVNPFGGNLGLGVVPSAWAIGKVLQIASAGGAFVYGASGQTILGTNAFFDTSWKYGITGQATYYEQALGVHSWHTAPSGTAGNAISFTQAMTLDASGSLLVGQTSSSSSVYSIETNRATDNRFGMNVGGVLTGALIAVSNEFRTTAFGASGVVTFQTNGTERARIDASGNLGVGTASASATLGRNITLNGAAAGTNTGLVFQSGNVERGVIYGSDTQLAVGSTTAIPTVFTTNNTERARITSAGSVVVGTAALATTATDGFLYVPTCAGTPTGVPTTQTGTAAIVINTTNNKLYFYSGGAWRDAGP